MIRLYEVFYMAITDVEVPRKYYFCQNEIEADRIKEAYIKRYYPVVKSHYDIPVRFTYFAMQVRFKTWTYRNKHLLSLTEPAYSAEDAAKQVEMRMKDDGDFIKICQVKPRQETYSLTPTEETMAALEILRRHRAKIPGHLLGEDLP
jgi:hypothetical protein